MRYKKTRGQRRRHRLIEQWRLQNMQIDLNHLQNYNCDYVKIFVHPWCDLSITNSIFPEPKRKTKLLMLSALLDIYFSWKQQLDSMNQSYYLKIWLYEPNFSKSQVVCAVDDRIDHYNNIFLKAEDEKKPKTSAYGQIEDRLKMLNWQHYLHEDFIDEDVIGEPNDYTNYNDYLNHKKCFTQLMRKPHRVIIHNNGSKTIGFIKGDIWIGG